ncbi:MAG: hypothetical protein IKX00_04640 [Bacilli bacterium]|nr:hypothetical protein [Bacilli bacterium]
MLLGDLAFCVQSSPIWQLVGRILMVFKIVIPILLIVFGMIDLGKAVIASKDDAVEKATQTLIKRLIAGVVIFFIPFLVGAIFNLIDSFKDLDGSSENGKKYRYNVCQKCVTSPNGSSCSSAVQEANK